MRKEDKTFMAVEGKAKTSVEQNNSDTFNLMFLKASFKHPSESINWIHQVKLNPVIGMEGLTLDKLGIILEFKGITLNPK